MRVEEAIRWAKAKFERINLDNPAQNAEILLEYVLGKGRLELYLDDQEISKQSLDVFKTYVKKRCMHMPVAYITGETEFMSLPFSISEEVFIPRPETEILVEISMSKLRKSDEVIDMCTGCGNLAISLARYSSCRVYACDISGRAIEISRRNAARNEVCHLTSFFQGDMFGPLTVRKQFDLVVSNPPYIRHEEIPGLSAEVRNFEPSIALDGGEDGLKFYRIISGVAKSFLKPRGYLIVEVGFDQAHPVCDIFKKHLKSVEVIRDYSGVERIVVGRVQ